MLVKDLRKIFFLFCLIFTSSLFSQVNKHIVFSHVYTLPETETTIKAYFTYKVPIVNLIFTKNSDSYSAGVQINLELSDSILNSIQRYSAEKYIDRSDFISTEDPNTFLEGLIAVQIENQSSKLIADFVDMNSQKTIFKKEEIITNRIEEPATFFPPIILKQEQIECDGIKSKALTNYGNLIPFGSENYDLLLTSSEVNKEKLFVKVISQRDTILNTSIERTDIGNVNLNECNDKVVLKFDSALSSASGFLIAGLTSKLLEGSVELVVADSESFQNKKVFRNVVRWLNKPKSLRDPQIAVKFLKFIVSDDSVKSILRNYDDYEKALSEFWKKSDPSPSSEFNELMAEFYARIDFANENFSTITGVKGVETDRAKVYVLYGKPTSTERGSDTEGNIFETWIYSKLQKKFIFVDKRGIGEFVLKSSQ